MLGKGDWIYARCHHERISETGLGPRPGIPTSHATSRETTVIICVGCNWWVLLHFLLMLHKLVYRPLQLEILSLPPLVFFFFFVKIPRHLPYFFFSFLFLHSSQSWLYLDSLLPSLQVTVHLVKLTCLWANTLTLILKKQPPSLPRSLDAKPSSRKQHVSHQRCVTFCSFLIPSFLF